MTDRSGGLSASSHYRQWSDIDGTLHVEIVLTPADQIKLGPYTMAQLRGAGLLIQAVFTEPD